MTSTYSPDLRLELMATGDQSGTWGDTTNTNLGTLLEQAICGVLSVAQGDVANLTLTALNGASDQSRNSVVNLTGALTAARNVVVPTSQKVYLVKNSTTGGFAITVKTTAGTGIAVAAGTSQWVYCDGTNVVQGLVGNGVPDVNGNISAVGFIPGFATTATAAGTTTLTVSSTQVQQFTGTTTQTVVLPVVSTLALGQSFTLVNQSTGALTVNSSGNNLVATVAPGTTTTVECVLITGTSAASWALPGFGFSTVAAARFAISAFGVIRTQKFPSSGTYTPNSNMLYCIMEAVGGGGGGGGAATTTAGTVNSGGGGGGGGYSRLTLTAATVGSSQVVTIGAAGAGATAGANNGGAGGDTSIGSLCIGKGGGGGLGAASGASGGAGVGGVAGTGDLLIPGGNGFTGFRASSTAATPYPPSGGSSFFGFGGGLNISNPGFVGTGYGAGGGGGSDFNGAGTHAGAAGTIGFVIITEFCSQ